MDHNGFTTFAEVVVLTGKAVISDSHDGEYGALAAVSFGVDDFGALGWVLAESMSDFVDQGGDH